MIAQLRTHGEPFPACRFLWATSASTAIWGRPSVLRDFSVFVSPSSPGPRPWLSDASGLTTDQPQTLKRRTKRYLAHTANVCLEEVSGRKRQMTAKPNWRHL